MVKWVSYGSTAQSWSIFKCFFFLFPKINTNWKQPVQVRNLTRILCVSFFSEEGIPVVIRCLLVSFHLCVCVCVHTCVFRNVRNILSLSHLGRVWVCMLLHNQTLFSCVFNACPVFSSYYYNVYLRTEQTPPNDVPYIFCKVPFSPYLLTSYCV